MKCQTLLLILLFVSPALSQEPMTVAQCRAKLEAWVPMFKAVYDAPECHGDGTVACAFSAPIRNLTSGQLATIVAEADGCAKLDADGDRYSYQRVATRAENILVVRTAYFLKETNQSAAFAAWESKHGN
jgi:hypothetical protein